MVSTLGSGGHGDPVATASGSVLLWVLQVPSTKRPKQDLARSFSNTRLLCVGLLSLLDRFLSTLIEVRDDQQDGTEHNEGDDPVGPVERR
jgi:hypothetical protein